jgi:DNA repair protein RadC
MTDELQRALGLMTIDLHDHLIVAGTQCISFKSLGHL